MVESRPLNYKIWQLAWPAILSNISVPMLGLVDAAILGHLNSAQFLAAVAIGTSVLSFLYWGFGFLRMGTTGLIARAFGAKDRLLDQQLLVQSLGLALVLGLAVILSKPLWSAFGLSLIAPSGDLQSLAARYIDIRAFSAPAVLLNYAIVGWFIGHQNTRWPMYFVIATNLLNIGLDFLLIIGLDLGSDGAALATLIAEYSGCGLALWALSKQRVIYKRSALWQQISRLGDYRNLLLTNQYLFFRTMFLLASFAFFTAMSGRLGIDTLAGNTILLNLLLLASYGLDGFAHAAEALCGHCLGAGDSHRFKLTVKICALWTAGTAAAFSAVFALASSIIFPLFTNLDSVLLVLYTYKYWLVVLPILASASYLLDGVFIGTAKSKLMMQTMLFSSLLVYLPLWYYLQPWGNHGLWLAFAAFNTARGASLLWCYWKIESSGGWNL
jgi:multidrug resistance protein, MATE family